MAQVLGRAEGTPAALASRLRLTLARLSRRVRQEGALAEEDLTPSRLAALTTLDESGPLTLGQLAAQEQVSSPNMTRIVARACRTSGGAGGLSASRSGPRSRRWSLV